ncbi:interleukin-15 receptor subunit alpha isoform X3 [Entelurus aequoreus]|uniref:interleukin-15 receptor subunit alpha isoform X3 n=1 Tax=Entelurus aequoreus TaxID=161455 RepID=UPI002B1D1082|nr:interleukin-15 receptor subunit alpha isoform X3 [Entelurus aequoreus]
MDLGSLLLCVCVMMASARAAGGEQECPCSGILPLPLTEPPDCQHNNKTFRYTCVKGYVRKAGTSNLINCREGSRWTKASLTCIRDPKATPQGDPKATPQGDPKATPQGDPKATPQGDPKATPQGDPTATPQGDPKTTPKAPNITQAGDTAASLEDNNTTASLEDNNATSSHSAGAVGSSTIAVISCLAVSIIALTAIAMLVYRRRRRAESDTPSQPAEAIPLHEVPSERG